MEELSYLHRLNIIIHVITGSTALLLGLFILVTKKGNKTHKKIGLLFLCLITIVIITGLLGIFVFGRNTFLLVITLLSAYQGFSGYRVLKTKSNKLVFIDVLASVVTLLSAIFFLYYLKSIGLIWAPVVIYSTIGYLFIIILYDFLRYTFSKKLYSKLWLYEHIIKMIGAFSALLSAFVGTVLSEYQPYSQILPALFGTLLIIGFVVYNYKKQTHYNV